MEIKDLQNLNRLAKESGAAYKKKRPIFDDLDPTKDRQIIGLAGSRGSGKTILLKQLLNEVPASFYLSLDTLNEIDLFELVQALSDDYQVKTLLLDEVHFYKDIDAHLKKIFDFLKVNIVFTSSISLLMHKSSYDLSRRVKLTKVPPFSFREFLYFKQGKLLEPLKIQDLLTKQVSHDYLQYEDLFDKYLQGANLPFSLEVKDPLLALGNVLEKIISQDIPKAASLKIDELQTITKVVSYISKAEADGVNPSSISKNINITKYKAEQYLELLSRAFVVNLVEPQGTNVLKEPKVLLSVPYRLLHKNYESAIGALREDFTVEMLKNAEINFNYLKDERGKKCPDYLINLENDEKLVIEVGGAGKSTSQFKGISDKFKKLVLRHGANAKGTALLSSLGFLY